LRAATTAIARRHYHGLRARAVARAHQLSQSATVLTPHGVARPVSATRRRELGFGAPILGSALEQGTRGLTEAAWFAAELRLPSMALRRGCGRRVLPGAIRLGLAPGRQIG
jgi:hypothetical protein